MILAMWFSLDTPFSFMKIIIRRSFPQQVGKKSSCPFIQSINHIFGNLFNRRTLLQHIFYTRYCTRHKKSTILLADFSGTQYSANRQYEVVNDLLPSNSYPPATDCVCNCNMLYIHVKSYVYRFRSVQLHTHAYVILSVCCEVQCVYVFISLVPLIIQ